MNVNHPSVLYLISRFLFLTLFFVPLNLQAETCQEYKVQLNQADSACNWEKIKEIEDIAIKTGETCLSELVEAAKCSYFYSCVDKELDRAYKTCNKEVILSIRDWVEDEMSECPNIFNMRERVLGIKCLYYDICEKAALVKSIENCEQEDFLKSIVTLTSGLMSDCPAYNTIERSLQKQKVAFFDSCIKSELIRSSDKCDLALLQRKERAIRESFSDVPNYKKVLILIEEFKCSYFDLCLITDFQKVSSECDIKKIIELEDLLLSDIARKCLFDSKTIITSLDKAKTEYYKNCAAKDIKEAYNKLDRELINLILKSLTTYPNNEIKHNLLREKARIFSKVVKNKLKEGIDSCNLDAIIQVEEFVYQERDLPNLGQIEEWVAVTKCGYFTRCVKEDLDLARVSCNLDRILEIEELTAKIKGASDCIDVNSMVQKSKCLYFLECADKDLDKAIENCDESRLREIDGLVGAGIKVDCPDVVGVLGRVGEAKWNFFTKCTEKNIYRALDNCDLDKLLALEENIYQRFQNSQDNKKAYNIVRELKCSYIEKCMKKEVDFLTHNCEDTRIKEIEAIVEEKMGDCPNYEIFKSTILKIKQECTRMATNPAGFSP
jgi:hypothetical protein